MTCEWPGCDGGAGERYRFCRNHHQLLPPRLRDQIWKGSNDGVQDWIVIYLERLYDMIIPGRIAEKAALSAFLATQAIKLVHVWNIGDRVNAMLEWPYDPVARKPLVTETHATGVGADAVGAVLNGLEMMGHNGLAFRLFLLSYMIDLNARSR